MSKKRIKICFVAPNMLGGGAERVISILVNDLYTKNYNVDLLLGTVEGSYLKDIISNVNVVDLNARKMIFSIPKIIKYLKLEKPDFIFTSHMYVGTLVSLAIKLSFIKTKLIIRQPTMLFPNKKKYKFLDLLKIKLFLYMSRFSEKIIVTSDQMYQEFKKYSKASDGKIQIIYNPIDVNKIVNKSKEKVAHEFFENKSSKIIIAVGRLVEVKDFKTLIRAVALVSDKIPVKLIILGDGELRCELEYLVAELNLENIVSFPGFVENPYKYMSRSDLFVSSSLWEGFSNVIIEAMACNLKIVATNCDGGSKEILADGKWGQLVPVQDEKIMADAILYSLNNQFDSNLLTRVDDFSLEKILSKYDLIFNNKFYEVHNDE